MRSFNLLSQIRGAVRCRQSCAVPVLRTGLMTGLLWVVPGLVVRTTPYPGEELPCNPDTLMTRLHHEGMLGYLTEVQAEDPDPASPFLALFQTPTAELAIVVDGATCAAAITALQSVDSTLTPEMVTVLRFGAAGYYVHASLDEDTYFFFDSAWVYLGALAGI